jgi:O-antigen ligase
MKRPLIITLLGLYFFCYTIPQYIPNLFYVYDRVTVQTLFLSAVNLISVILIIRKDSLNNLIPKLKTNYHYFSYLGVILIAILSLLVSENVVESLVTLTKILIFFISFSCIIYLAKQSKINFIQILIWFTFIAVFMESLFINYLYYNSVIINGELLARGNEFNGLGANINISSFSIAMKIPVILYAFFSDNSRLVKAISFVLISSSVLTILLLQSRGALLAIGFVLSCLFIISLIQRNRKYIKHFLGVLVMLICSFGVYQQFNEKNTSDMIVERFSTIADPGSDASVKERLNFYSTAVESITQNPFLGIGVGNWKVTSIKYSRDIISEYRVPYFVHNDFLQVTAETGIIGGILYMFFILYPLLISLFKTLENKIFDHYFLIFLILSVYSIDSMLNFPMDRPMTITFLFFIFSLFYILNNKNIVIDEK